MALPMISATGVPKWVSIFGSLAITLILTPIIPSAAVPEGLFPLMLAASSELIYGLTFAAIVRVVFSTVAIAGELMSMQTGMAMSVLFDPL